jgi:hypothetical protein
MRVQSSRCFSAALSEIRFDSYRIRPIPTFGGEEVILEFKDEWAEGQLASNPVQEAKLVLSWLAVVLRSRLNAGPAEVNNVPVSAGESSYRQFLGSIDPPSDLQALFDKLCSLDDKTLRTYLRACDLYHLAARVIDDRPSLANFLLVSSIECLGTIITPGGSFEKSFFNFIKAFCPKAVLGTDISQDTLDRLLMTIRSYRSQYAHGGKDVPVASLVADKHGLVWMKHFEEGKEELAPSISWFESVVQASLLEFFRRQPSGTPPPRKRERLVELAVSFGTARLKVKHSVVAGQILTREDLEIQ